MDFQQELQRLNSNMDTQKRANVYHESDIEQKIRTELYGARPQLNVWFYVGADEAPLDADGAPVFLEVPMVKIQVPGDKDSFSRHVTDEDKELYAAQWRNFLERAVKPKIPLGALPEMRPAIIKAFEKLGILSVDDLLDKEVPGYLNKFKRYATWIKQVHDRAAKPVVKLEAA